MTKETLQHLKSDTFVSKRDTLASKAAEQSKSDTLSTSDTLVTKRDTLVSKK